MRPSTLQFGLFIVLATSLSSSHPVSRSSKHLSTEASPEEDLDFRDFREQKVFSTCSPNTCCVGKIEGVTARACYKNGTVESLTSPKRGERLGIFNPIIIRSSSPVTRTDFTRRVPGRIKILNLNVWGLRFMSEDTTERVEALAKHLTEENYDVVFIQELWYNKDFHQIKNTLPYSTNYGSPYSKKCPSIPSDKRYLVQPLPVDCNGLTILSRTSLEDTSFKLYKHRVRAEIAEYFARRGVLRTRTVIEGHKVSLLNTHLATWHTDYESDYSSVRVAQAEELIAVARVEEEWADLVIVAGDMNATPQSEVMNKFVEAGLKDVVEGQEKFNTWGKRGNSYTGQEEGIRIDYVLYKGTSRDYEVTSAHILDLEANVRGQKKSISDHEGVECLIKLS